MGNITLPSPDEMAQLPPEVAAPLTSLAPVLAQGLLVVMLGALLAVHGTLALYFLSRRRRVAEFHSELPPWVARVVVTISGR